MLKVGDAVDYRGHQGIIVAIMPNTNPQEVKVEFFDKQLIPPWMIVPEWTCVPLPELEMSESELPTGINLLKPISGGYKLGKPNPDVICPVCETPWHETPHNTGIWYDCLKCGKTKEQIMSGK